MNYSERQEMVISMDKRKPGAAKGHRQVAEVECRRYYTLECRKRDVRAET